MNKLNKLQYPGVYIGRALAWGLKRLDAGSVKVWVNWQVTAAFIDGEAPEWESYAGYEPVGVFSDTFIIKNDGTVNASGVQQLRDALGWNGDIKAIAGPVPDLEAQLDVREEQGRDGVVRIQVAWLRHRDADPKGGGGGSKAADPKLVGDLDRQFGSLLRAAAGSKGAPGAPKAAPASRAPGQAAKPASAPRAASAPPAQPSAPPDSPGLDPTFDPSVLDDTPF